MPGCDVFPPTLYQQKVDRVLKDGVNGNIPDPASTPCFDSCRSGAAGWEMGPTWCRWAQENGRKSTVRTVGRVGLGTNVRPSCHSTPWTLDCAKLCSNAVIWTKNIGLSFLFPFFVNTVATFFFFLILWHTRMVVRPYQSVHVQNLWLTCARRPLTLQYSVKESWIKIYIW